MTLRPVSLYGVKTYNSSRRGGTLAVAVTPRGRADHTGGRPPVRPAATVLPDTGGGGPGRYRYHGNVPDLRRLGQRRGGGGVRESPRDTGRRGDVFRHPGPAGAVPARRGAERFQEERQRHALRRKERGVLFGRHGA